MKTLENTSPNTEGFQYFSDAGWTPQNHTRRFVLVENFSENRILPHNVGLSNVVFKVLWPHSLRQRYWVLLIGLLLENGSFNRFGGLLICTEFIKLLQHSSLFWLQFLPIVCLGALNPKSDFGCPDAIEVGLFITLVMALLCFLLSTGDERLSPLNSLNDLLPSFFTFASSFEPLRKMHRLTWASMVHSGNTWPQIGQSTEAGSCRSSLSMAVFENEPICIDVKFILFAA